MRFLVFLVILFLFFSVYEAQHQPIVLELYGGMYVGLAPGTPKQNVGTGIINMFVGELLFVDQNCGKHQTDCPRYCQEPAFFRAYCPLGCDPNLNPTNRRLYCGKYDSSRYKSNESSTFEIVQPFKKWTYQSAHYRPFEGIWIPAYQLSSLLKRRLLLKPPSEELLTAPCNSTKLDLTIQIGNRKIFIPSNTTISDYIYDYKLGLCYTQISSIPTASYTNTTTWSFGTLIKYCLFLDYEHMNIELGTRID
ncbi:hypothetical protein M3Y95_00829500 [Aphelenchoides besseyi]|nr:hypothetical protein M3Y95_00829500 [Aphelenchoides besseyi]